MSVAHDSSADLVDVEPAILRDSNVLVHQASDADACGSMTCAETDNLVRVYVGEYDRRVLCPEHAADYIRQEVGR